jgi:PmbA protein
MSLTLRQTQDYVMKKLLQMGADDVVVGVEIENATQMKFVNNAMAATKHWSDVAVSAFMAEKKRVVGTSIVGYTKNMIDRTLKRMWTLAHSVPPSNDYYRIAHGPFRYKQIPKTYDKRILNIEHRGVDILEGFIFWRY